MGSATRLFVTIAALCLPVGGVHAQDAARPFATDATRAVLGGSGVGVGVRALGMGGAHTSLASDSTALYWNPAGLATVSACDWQTTVCVRASGLDDVAQDAQDAYDALKDGSVTADEFATLAQLALRRRDRTARVSGTGGGMTGVATAGFGLGLIGEAGIAGSASYATTGNAEVLDVAGEAAWCHSIALGYGRQVAPGLSVGVGARRVSVHHRRADYTATRVGGSVSSSASEPPEYSDEALALDLGVLYSPRAEIQAGLMIRNLNSPDLALASRTGRLGTSLEPCVNLGISTRHAGWIYALDIHNLFDANDAGGPSLHLGAERPLSRSVAFRAGLNDGDLAFGLGCYLGPVTVELAADTSLRKQAGMQVGVSF